MASEEEEKLYNELKDRGCCKRCILRYINQPLSLLTYDDPDICLINLGLIPPMIEILEGPNRKKLKQNPCVVCLDLLDDDLLGKMLSDEALKTAESYQYEACTLHITFPTCLLLRDHSMRIHLKQLFPNLFDDTEVAPINHAWRYSIQKKLSQIVNKKTVRCGQFGIHFFTNCQLEIEEVSVIKEWCKRGDRDPFSKHSISVTLLSLPDEKFKELVPVPPKAALYNVTYTELVFTTESINLTGKYCKYSRHLPQIPIRTDKKLVIDYSIQTIIEDAVRAVKCDFSDISFQASSYDDKTWRVLGEGRTFHLQITDPKFQSFSPEDLRQIEKNVAASRCVEINKLKADVKKAITISMKSEALRPRSLCLLCIIYDYKNVQRCINATNMYQNISVQQKTPIKLLNQREDVLKRKEIRQIKAKHLQGNLVEVEMCADGGLHIEEFVNGDFGRTYPSLCDIMKAKIDLLAIDVVEFQSTLQYTLEEKDVVI